MVSNIEDTPPYDVCIVGAGMTGSAAARWVSQQGGLKSCLVGPLEPTEEEWSDPSRTIFGAHYDSCRIVSELAASRSDKTWPILVQRSINRFRQLEKESGVEFFSEVGCLTKAGDNRFAEIESKMRPNLDVNIFEGDEFTQSFPFFKAKEIDEDPNNSESNAMATHKKDLHSVLERTNAGYIDPTKYIAANTAIAVGNGCEVIDDVVCEIVEAKKDNSDKENTEESSEGRLMRVVTKTGRTLMARRVLLCAGAFTNFERLLPADDLEIDISLTSEVALFMEVSEEDVRRLSSMPCMLVYCDDMYDWRNTYLSPPIKHRDGKSTDVNCQGRSERGRAMIPHEEGSLCPK